MPVGFWVSTLFCSGELFYIYCLAYFGGVTVVLYVGGLLGLGFVLGGLLFSFLYTTFLMKFPFSLSTRGLVRIRPVIVRL